MTQLIQFVQNYQDLSTDKGFQFKFFCDKCHNGYMTRFQTSTLGMAESALHIAGSLFGGIFNTVGNSAYEVQRAIGGKAHDAALEEAVAEGKQYFQQCTRCGKWVCPEVCWNGQAGLCEGCAPNMQEELAAAHARAKVDAARVQLQAEAEKQNYVAGIDMSAGAVLRAPGPAAAAPAPATAAASRCTSCGATMSPGAKFCPQCGAAKALGGCPGCGSPLQPNTKFCGECGHKLA
jgi:uncharacterized OB-fold protein